MLKKIKNKQLFIVYFLDSDLTEFTYPPTPSPILISPTISPTTSPTLSPTTTSPTTSPTSKEQINLKFNN